MELSKEQIKILESLKFDVLNDTQKYNINDYFGILPEYYFNANFGVAGDHANDLVEFYYLNNLTVNGFYYSSSLFDTFYHGEYKQKLDNIISEVKNYVDWNVNIDSKEYSVNLVTKTTNHTTWFIIECNLANDYYSKLCLESLVKASIVLDYLMQKFEKEYYEKLNIDN